MERIRGSLLCWLAIVQWSGFISPVVSSTDSLFTVSSLAYSPGTPESESRISITFASSEDVIPANGDTYSILFHFPESFSVVGLAPTAENCASLYSRFGEYILYRCRTTFSLDHDRLLPVEYASFDSGELGPIVAYMGDSGSVAVSVSAGLSANVPIKLVLCCMRLPSAIEANSESVTISLEKHSAGGSLSSVIPESPVMWSPRILAVDDWTELRLTFDPAKASAPTTLSLTVQPSQSVPAGSIFEVSLGSILLDSSIPDPTHLEFTVVSNINNLLEYYASFSLGRLSFRLASIWTPDASAAIKISGFILPDQLALNEPSLKARITSGDGQSALVSETSFFHSDAVLENFHFHVSQFSADGEFSFALNRDLAADSRLCLRLPGYEPAAVPVPVTGLAAVENEEAEFDASRQLFCVVFSQPLPFDGSGSVIVTFRLRGLTLPLGQYEGDPSLQAQVEENEFFPIENSPKFGVEKLFISSSLAYDPAVAGSVFKLSVSFHASVSLYPGTVVKLFLRGGFSREKTEPEVKIYGDSATLFGGSAVWDVAASVLAIAVAVDHVVSGPVSFFIPAGEEFVLPQKLSENDQILLIESTNGVVIVPESIRLSPRVGSVQKAITESTIQFNPTTANAPSAVSISFVSNTDLLIGSELVLHLGGFSAPSPLLVLTGTHAPSIWNQQGIWKSATQDAVMILGVAISANTRVELTISSFTLPNALRANDESLYLTVANMGIAHPQFFDSNDRINNQVVKKLSQSALTYTGVAAPYPGRAEPFRIDFVPTFDILSGAIIQVHLPGFLIDSAGVSPVVTPLAPLTISQSSWDVATSVLSVSVVFGAKNVAAAFTVGPQLKVPPSTAVNDPALRLSLGGTMWLPAEPIETSPAVIAREFVVSELSFAPKIPKSTVQLSLKLVASVAIEADDELVVHLPSFTRVDAAASVDVLVKETASNAALSLMQVTWDPTQSSLHIVFASPLVPSREFVVTIPESSGFVLPASLPENDPRFTIGIAGSVAVASIRTSPLVGDGASKNQNFCMYMFETSPRIHIGSDSCDCPAADPCVAADLAKCGCAASTLELSQNPLPFFSISGFNLRADDELFFVPIGTSCEGDRVKGVMQVSGVPSVSGAGLAWSSVRAVKSGKFSVCLDHIGANSLVGEITVRPKCAHVGYNGGCFSHCPAGTVPVYGHCEPLASLPLRNGFLAFKLTVNAPDVSLTDSGRKFFEFQLIELIESVVNEPTDSGRFLVAALRVANDAVDATIVIAPGAEGDRCSEELFLLWGALAQDRAVPETFLSYGAAREVTKCAGEFRSMCPSPLSRPSWHPYAVFLGGLVTGLAVLGALVSVYRLDSAPIHQPHLVAQREVEKSQAAFRAKNNDFSVIKVNEMEVEITSDPVDLRELDQAAQVQLAKDWLDGKLLTDEPLMLKRRSR